MEIQNKMCKKPNLLKFANKPGKYLKKQNLLRVTEKQKEIMKEPMNNKGSFWSYKKKIKPGKIPGPDGLLGPYYK